jgi:hypothetical protein
LFKYGKKIHDKIVQSMQPEFEDEKPINPFDFWKGADFKLKIRKVAGYINYDKSEFDNPSELFNGDDTKLESLWKKQYSLREFTSADTHKSFEELQSRYDVVMGLSDGGVPRKASAEDVDLDEEETPRAAFKPSGATKPSAPAKKPAPAPKKVVESEDEDSDDAMSYFERLASDDN